ncbi:unnamed protein product [Effrenium voratum]|nr:unnamed protein product [Effrenium voratum]
MDTHARWKEDYDDGRWWVGCRRRFLHEVAAVRGVREASAAWEMLPDELDPQRLALLDLDSTASTASVFPAEFCIAGADPEGPRRSGTVCPGYLVAAFGDSPYEVADAMWTLSQAWWALVKATSRLVTLVFVTGLGGNSLEADAHEEASFLELYRRCLMQAPAPLIFAAQRKGGGRRPRLLGGWQILKAHRDQAEEWLHPGSWKWGGAERWGSAPSGPSGPSHPGRGGKGAGRWEDEAWDAWEAWEDDSEDALLESVTAFLGSGPKEVQELASLFAGRFNAVVRADPRNGFSQDKKNDGSFKKWLLTCGFEASALFDRNKCMISVPHAKRTTRGTRGGRKNRNAERAANSEGEDAAFEPPYGLHSHEAQELEEEVVAHLRRGDCDMGALRQVNDLGRRFNEVFFQKSKVNDGSWKKWLASIRGVEVVVDPKVAAYHGNKPTVVRLLRLG